MQIREAQAADVPTLADFARFTYARAFGHSFAPADLEHHLTQRLSEAYFAQALTTDTILLAYDPALIGFAQIGPYDEAPADAQLRRLYVHPDRQSTGIGSTLMHAAFELPNVKAAEHIYLDVWDQNESARRLYERHGFKVIGKLPFTTPTGTVIGHDLLMMRGQG